MAADRRRYRKVFVRIWASPDFQALNDGERVMALYLLSGPQTNRAGFFRVSFALAAEDLGASQDVIKRRFDRVIRVFGWEFDQHVKVLWIPSWWSFNAPADNEKNWQGCLSDLNEVPRTHLIHKFCKQLTCVPPMVHKLFEGWNTALTPSEHCSSTDTNTDTNTARTQEQEQEQEQDVAARNKPRAVQTEDKDLQTGAFIRRFCELYAKYRHGAKYHIVSTRHIPLVRALLRTHGFAHLEKLAAVLLTATADEWLNGTDRGIEVLHSKINWVEQTLRDYEAQHGEIKVAS